LYHTRLWSTHGQRRPRDNTRLVHPEDDRGGLVTSADGDGISTVRRRHETWPRGDRPSPRASAADPRKGQQRRQTDNDDGRFFEPSPTADWAPAACSPCASCSTKDGQSSNHRQRTTGTPKLQQVITDESL
jgi:hypothetical protein